MLLFFPSVLVVIVVVVCEFCCLLLEWGPDADGNKYVLLGMG